MVKVDGFEPPTSRPQTERSDQTELHPEYTSCPPIGFETRLPKGHFWTGGPLLPCSGLNSIRAVPMSRPFICRDTTYLLTAVLIARGGGGN